METGKLSNQQKKTSQLIKDDPPSYFLIIPLRKNRPAHHDAQSCWRQKFRADCNGLKWKLLQKITDSPLLHFCSFVCLLPLQHFFIQNGITRIQKQPSAGMYLAITYTCPPSFTMTSVSCITFRRSCMHIILRMKQEVPSCCRMGIT